MERPKPHNGLCTGARWHRTEPIRSRPIGYPIHIRSIMRRVACNFAIGLCCAVAAYRAYGQSGPTLVGAVPGMDISFGTRIAPGQILTLQVANGRTMTGTVRATRVPLPKSLAGVSVTVKQALPAGRVVEYPAP